MEFKKLYRLTGEQDPTVVLINDEGEEYPVFLESLHNTILFPEVLRSGYKLAGLPYDFVKDGMSLMDLPVEQFPYASDGPEMQQMYDAIGQKMSIADISKHIDVTVAKGIPMPATKYVITSRQQFLDYLKNYDQIPSEDDFMPINYFVAPAARFTISEYLSEDNSDYVRIMNRRRRMSIKKFHRLVRWLENNGLQKNSSFVDVINAYFAWGLDGLNEMYLSKKASQSPLNLVAGSHNFQIDPRVMNSVSENPYTAYDYTYGLVDSSGRWKLAPEDQNKRWRPIESNPKKFDEFCQSIPIGQYRLLKMKAPAIRTIYELQGNECNLRYSNNSVVLTTVSASRMPVYHTYPTIIIPSLTNANATLPGNLALPHNIELFNEYCKIEALAKYVYNIRKDRRTVSSYDAMLASGASPEDAILYILTFAGFITDALDRFSGDEIISEESSMVQIPPDTISEFLAGKRTQEENTGLSEAFNAINSVIVGDMNIDGVSIGKQSDAMVDLSSIQEDIRALYKILGVPLMDIYDKVNARPNGAAEIIFEGNGLNYALEITPISFAVEGFASDLKKYQMNQAQNATRFYEVLQVAREICTPGENGTVIKNARPVAIEYLYANCGKTSEGNNVNKVLMKIQETLMEELSMQATTNLQMTNKYAKLKRTFSMQAWFEMYHKGYYTLPKDAGSKRINVPVETLMTVRKYTKTGIDSTSAMSRAMICHTYNGNPNNPNCTRFIQFCVNAYVGDTFVIPKAPGATLHEAPFYALWFRWDPAHRAKLIDSGAINANHVPWELRYIREMAIRPYDNELQCLDHPFSLTYYYKQASKYMTELPATYKFERAPHPVEYLYPGLYLDMEGNSTEEDPVRLPVPRTGAPAVEVLTPRELDKKIYYDNRLHVSYAENPDSYIRKFVGFDIESLMSGQNAVDLLPDYGFNDIIVMDENVVFSGSGQVVNYTRLTESMTPFFKHVSGRFNLLRDMNGDLWEVRI